MTLYVGYTMGSATGCAIGYFTHDTNTMAHTMAYSKRCNHGGLGVTPWGHLPREICHEIPTVYAVGAFSSWYYNEAREARRVPPWGHLPREICHENSHGIRCGSISPPWVL